ncbi:PapG chaperone-binding domain-containing protein [Serratia marcescens]
MLDHGTINLDESSSSRVEKSIEVQCSVASNLKLVIATGEQGKLVLSGGEGAGFYSSLTLDGMYANDGVVLSNVGPAGRRVTLVSNLHAGTGSGVFTGSAVMILAIP